MAYCLPADVRDLCSEAELAQLTTEAGATGDDTIIAEGITKADAEIDAYLGAVMVVPVSPVPPLLKSLSVDMALWHIFSRRSFVNELRRMKYEDALALLKQIAAGKATIGPASTAPESHPVDIESETRIFTRADLVRW